MKVALLPRAAKLAVVALHAVDPHAEKGPADLRGEFSLVGTFARLARDGDKIHGRAGRPHALRSDQLTNDAIIRPVLQQRLAEPFHEPATPINQKRAVLRAHIHSRQTLREVVTGAAILQKTFEPLLRHVVALHCLHLANLFQRGNAARESQREPADDREVIRTRRGGNLLRGPIGLKSRIHLRRDLGSLARCWRAFSASGFFEPLPCRHANQRR